MPYMEAVAKQPHCSTRRVCIAISIVGFSLNALEKPTFNRGCFSAHS